MQLRLVATTYILLFLAGCASTPQAPVTFSVTKFADPNIRVGVAMTPPKRADTYFPGANCLLCMAAASAMNSSLTTYTQALPVDEVATLKSEIAALLRKKGATVKIIDEAIDIDGLPKSSLDGTNLAKKDYRQFKTKYDIDKLYVINIQTIGMLRTYSAYFPTSEPKAVITGSGFIVNLADNSYDWFEPINILRAAEGKWDEPPKFPGLTNAYFQAIEAGKDNLKKPLTP